MTLRKDIREISEVAEKFLDDDLFRNATWIANDLVMRESTHESLADRFARVLQPIL